MFEYNPTYFDGTCLIDTRNKLKSFKHFQMEDGFLIGIFQGSYGDRPDVDFIIKFLQPGKKKKLRTPEHMHWVVDLLLKMEIYKEQVKGVVKYYHDFYYTAPVFTTVADRDNYVLVSPSIVKEKYKELKHGGTYSIEYIAHLIELFTVCEKVSPRKNKMFERALKTLNDYCEGKKDFYQVMSATKPGYRKKRG